MSNLQIFFKKILRSLLIKTPQFLLASCLAILLFLYLGTTAAFFGGILFFWWFLGLPSKVIFFIAILSIISLPFSSILKLEYWEQNLAIFGFYFLCIAAFLASWEHYNLSKFINKYNKKFESAILPNFKDFQKIKILTHFEPFQNLHKLKEKHGINEQKTPNLEIDSINPAVLPTIISPNYNSNQQNSGDFKTILQTSPNINKNSNLIQKSNETVKKILQKPAIGSIIIDHSKISDVSIQNNSNNKSVDNLTISSKNEDSENENSANFLPKLSNELIFNSPKNQNNYIPTNLLNRKQTNLQNKIKNTKSSASKPDASRFSFAIFLLVFTINYLLAFGVFRFENIAIFRDFIGIKIANFSFFPFSLVSYIVWFFSQITSLGISPVIFWSFFFQIIFAGTSTLVYFCLDRWTFFFGKNTLIKKLLCFLLGVFYAFNSWTLERFFMGQIIVLVGHLAILPCIYQLFKFHQAFKIINLQEFEKPEFQQRRQQNILEQSLILAILWTLLTFISIHHAFLFGIIFFVSFICYFFASIVKPSSSFYTAHRQKRLSTLFWQSFLVFLISIPSVFLAFLQKTQFQTTNLENSQNQIVKGFSPQFLENQNGFIRIMIGSGSWMTQTFIEIYENLSVRNNTASASFSTSYNIQNLLGNFSNLTLYFNQNLALTFILTIFLIITIIFWHNLSKVSNFSKTSNRTWLIFSLIILALSGIWTFGYSLGFEFFNQLFYTLPFTMILRESGKFYSLFLAFLIIILSLPLPKFWREIRLLVVFIFTFSSFLPFTVISQSLNYVKIPKIFEFTNTKCQENQQENQAANLLLLPHNQYILPSWSRVFVPTPSSFYFNCHTIIPNNTNIQIQNLRVPLQKTELDKKILQITQDFAKESSGTNTDINFVNSNTASFLEEFEKLKINLILTDSFDAKTSKFATNLQNEVNQNNSKITKLQTEETLTLWQINQ